MPRIVAVAVVLLAYLNSLAQKVTIDFDKGTDFSRSKTYAWIKGTPAIQTLKPTSTLWA